jgi:hypothetical protein
MDRWIDGCEGEAEVTAMERFMCVLFACGWLVDGWVWVLCLRVYMCTCGCVCVCVRERERERERRV